MVIFADECVNKDVIENLKDKGFKVIDVFAARLQAADDDKIFQYAAANSYIFLTFDKDFGNILMFNIEKSAGVIVVYVENMTREEIVNNTADFFQQFTAAQLKGKLFIIEKGRIRIWHR